MLRHDNIHFLSAYRKLNNSYKLCLPIISAGYMWLLKFSGQFRVWKTLTNLLHHFVLTKISSYSHCTHDKSKICV